MRTTAQVVRDDAGKIICKEAERLKPAAVVMGTHGRSLIQRSAFPLSTCLPSFDVNASAFTILRNKRNDTLVVLALLSSYFNTFAVYFKEVWASIASTTANPRPS